MGYMVCSSGEYRNLMLRENTEVTEEHLRGDPNVDLLTIVSIRAKYHERQSYAYHWEPMS